MADNSAPLTQPPKVAGNGADSGGQMPQGSEPEHQPRPNGTCSSNGDGGTDPAAAKSRKRQREDEKGGRGAGGGCGTKDRFEEDEEPDLFSKDLQEEELQRRKGNGPVRKSGVILMGSTVTPPRQNGISGSGSGRSGIIREGGSEAMDIGGGKIGKDDSISSGNSSTSSGSCKISGNGTSVGANGRVTPPVAHKRATGIYSSISPNYDVMHILSLFLQKLISEIFTLRMANFYFH